MLGSGRAFTTAIRRGSAPRWAARSRNTSSRTPCSLLPPRLRAEGRRSHDDTARSARSHRAQLALLVCFLGQIRAAGGAAEVAPVLRGRALQIVDDGGRVRASISVLPAGSGGAEMAALGDVTEHNRIASVVVRDISFR